MLHSREEAEKLMMEIHADLAKRDSEVTHVIAACNRCGVWNEICFADGKDYTFCAACGAKHWLPWEKDQRIEWEENHNGYIS